MNFKQIEYLAGVPLMKYSDLSMFIFGSYLGFSSVYHFTHDNLFAGAFCMPMALISLFQASMLGISRLASHKGIHTDIFEISPISELDDVEKYPYQNIEFIEIADKEGLDVILERTSKNFQFKEWMTVISSHLEGSGAVIDDIMDPQKAVDEGFVQHQGLIRCDMNILLMIEKEYNGHSHFHPPIHGIALNYNLNPLDRLGQDNWINLLTFKIKGKPEVVGYNRRHVFIPMNEDKTFLARASYKDVWNYLGEK